MDKSGLAQTLRTEWDKWRTLDTRQKWLYFEDYYLMWVLGTAGTLLLIVVSAFTIFWNNTEVVIEGSCVNLSVTAECKTAVTEDFVEYLRQNAEKPPRVGAEAVLYEDVELVYELEKLDQFTYAALQRLMAQASAGELDYLLMDEESYYHFMQNDAYADLSDLLGQDTLSELSGMGCLVNAVQEETQWEYPAGIALHRTSFAQRFSGVEQAAYLVFMSNGKHLELAEELVRVMVWG